MIAVSGDWALTGARRYPMKDGCTEYPATRRDGRSSDLYPPYPAAMRVADPLFASLSGMPGLHKDHRAGGGCRHFMLASHHPIP